MKTPTEKTPLEQHTAPHDTGHPRIVISPIVHSYIFSHHLLIQEPGGRILEPGGRIRRYRVNNAGFRPSALPVRL